MKYSAIILSFTLFIIGCSGVSTSDEEKDFVKVLGSQFILDEKPYYFVGTNMWYGCYLGSPGETEDRERLKRELDFLKSQNITNLRVLAASEESTIKRSIKPAIQKSPGVYDEDLLKGLDFLLAEIGKRDMHAVVFLHNFWEWSGGMSQYNEWFGGELVDLGDPTISWPDYGNSVASFYQNEGAMSHFRKYVKNIVHRKNTITDEYYYDDPAIMAWQLSNEPRPGVGEVARQNIKFYYKWIDETAGYIHSLDTNHLVTTGNEGTVGSLDSEEIYLKGHQSKHVDYITFHIWAKNWRWIDPNNMEGTYQTAENNMVDYFNLHMKLARKLNKPITLEEFGMSRDDEKFEIGSPTIARDKYFTKIFECVYDSAASGAPIAGTNFWTWGGEGRAQQEDFIWKVGDGFTGDPPQEAQGLNSVFDVDESTLKIIKDHGNKMIQLRDKETIAGTIHEEK